MKKKTHKPIKKKLFFFHVPIFAPVSIHQIKTDIVGV